jgi:hypothetical protein
MAVDAVATAHILTCVVLWNPYRRERLSTVVLLVIVAWFVKRKIYIVLPVLPSDSKSD